MNAFAALAYADGRRVVNTLQTLRRRPGRLTMWVVYAAVIVGFAIFKTQPRGHPVAGAAAVGTGLDDLLVCGLTFAFGLTLATGTQRWLGIFSGRAEALLMVRTVGPPLLVAGYLQLRVIAAILAQGVGRFAYLVVLVVPTGTPLPTLLAEVLFFGAAGAAVASIALPRSLSRGVVRVVATLAGWAILIAAALPLLIDLLGLLHIRLAGLEPFAAWHPGTILLVIAAGDPRPLAVPLGIAAAASLAFVLAARDPYPELYAISLANLDWKVRLGSRRGASLDEALPAGASPRARSSAPTGVRGALAFVWLDALGFTRRQSPARAAWSAFFALAGGAVVAATAGRGHADVVFAALAGTLPGIYIAIASMTGVRLAPALRMPLFWLGDAPLAARLGAWAFGPFWRDATLATLAAAGYAAVAHAAREPLFALIGAVGLMALTRAVGLAVFALLPNSLDQRGPAVFVRAMLSYALIAPAAIAGTLAAFLLHAALPAGIVLGAAVAFLEAAALVAFAAWRLAGRVDRLAVA